MPHSLLRHIGRAIFFNSFSENLSVAMFTAYFDASGTKRMPVLTVAGFVSHVKRWERFDQKWAAILSRYKVTSLHTTDFASSLGEYKSWRGKTEMRRDFIAELVECIRQETKRGFAASVVIPEYEEVDAEYKLREAVGKPYPMCGAACLGGLRKWTKKKKKKLDPSELLVVVEEGDEDQGEFLDRARREGFKAIPLPKSDARAFQAGDLVGWKSRIIISNALSSPLATVEDAENIIRSMDPIKGIVHDNGAHDKASLMALCEASKVPRRHEKITA